MKIINTIHKFFNKNKDKPMLNKKLTGVYCWDLDKLGESDDITKIETARKLTKTNPIHIYQLDIDDYYLMESYNGVVVNNRYFMGIAEFLKRQK